MIGQVVGGVIGGADGLHLEAIEDAPGAQTIRGELFVGACPDALRVGGIKQFVDAEVALQLKVGPMIERVAEGVRDGLCPGEELVLWGGGSGDELLIHAVGPHGAPFVVIAFQPDLEQVGELAVLGHIAGGRWQW